MSQPTRTPTAPVPPYVPAADARTAASLLLLRDGGDGLEVLMLRRAERENDMRSGLAVFPGGVLDPRDREVHALALGLDDATASAQMGLAEGGLDYWVAAVRETFEEVGVLLVAEAFDAAAVAPWRDRLQASEVGLVDFCRHFGLTPDLRGMQYHAHWLTPPGTPKRFDTRFFVMRAPQGQEAQADEGEAVELMWLTPAQALDKARGLKLLPVTRETLRELGRHASVDAALAASRARVEAGEVRLVMPRRAVTARGPGVVLPHELPYAEVARLDPEGRGDAFADLVPGRVVELALRDGVRLLRVTAPNPGPMTGPGTNSYLLGSEAAGYTVIDPGPDIAVHVQALQAAASTGRIVRILVTHTHRDHSPAAAPLAAATGAPVWGRVARHPMWQDEHFAAQHAPAHGERLELAPGCTLRVLHTPGHASSHLCYLWEQERLLFTGDHVMQGSTVVINPPDGDMSAYLRSLEALLDEALQWLAPGHGFLVAEPHAVLQALVAHRLRREAKVRSALQAVQGAHGCSLAELLPAVYDDVPAALHPVAARSLLAHLLKLVADGVARQEPADADDPGDPAQARWSLA